MHPKDELHPIKSHENSTLARPCIEVRAKKDIKPKDKLYICYGDDFWGNDTDVEQPVCPVCGVSLKPKDEEQNSNTYLRRPKQVSTFSKNKRRRHR